MMPRLSLLVKIWLSTAVAVTVLFGVTFLLLQGYILRTTTATLKNEMTASLQAYESLWRTRSETLASVAAIISSTPNVRAAFETRHRATIEDVAGELWLKVSDQLKETAFFVVTDPLGNTVAALDSSAPMPQRAVWPVVRSVGDRFPQQASGFSVIDGTLYQLVLTPVYVDSGRGSSLVSVLITGQVVNHAVARELKESTNGTEFVFVSGDQVFASTLNGRATEVLHAAASRSPAEELVSDGVIEYASMRHDLSGLNGQPAGTLYIFRSFDNVRTSIRDLERYLVLPWLGAIAAGLGVSYLLARRIVQPIQRLDRAAAEVARENYQFRVPPAGDDELGRLSATFNSMCDSLQSARQELIRQERIATVGRLASSIVHDLRNPLAAIYGGAEMMVDTQLTPAQVKRVALNIYKSSQRIQEMLQDLLQGTRGRTGSRELCQLADVVQAGVDALQPAATGQRVNIQSEIPAGIELSIERSRVERVFVNLIGNALEVMPDGGEIRIRAREAGGNVEIEVSDSGPGVPLESRDKLFQPFFTQGKRNGLGLGLALSRQTVLDHGGEIWLASGEGRGATFVIRLPKLAVAPESAA